MDYQWQKSDRVCSAHFPRGHYYGNNNIPAIFPRKDKQTDQIVWPVDISYLLNPETATSTESLDKRAESVDLCTTPTAGEQERSQERTCSENQTKETPHGETLPSENTCECGKEIGELKKRIKELEKRREIETFGVRRFMASDSDIRIYMGLPDYATFVSLYNFVKPKPGFNLNYYNGYTNAAKDPSYVVSRGRPRNLCEID